MILVKDECCKDETDSPNDIGTVVVSKGSSICLVLFVKNVVELIKSLGFTWWSEGNLILLIKGVEDDKWKDYTTDVEKISKNNCELIAKGEQAIWTPVSCNIKQI